MAVAKTTLDDWRAMSVRDLARHTLGKSDLPDQYMEHVLQQMFEDAYA